MKAIPVYQITSDGRCILLVRDNGKENVIDMFVSIEAATKYFDENYNVD